MRMAKVSFGEANMVRVAVRFLIERDRRAGVTDDDPITSLSYLALMAAIFPEHQHREIFRREAFAPTLSHPIDATLLSSFHPKTLRLARRLARWQSLDSHFPGRQEK